MNQADAISSSAEGQPRSQSLGDQMKESGKSAADTVGEAKKAVMEEAKSLGGRVKNLAEDQAEGVKETAASGMDAFADALRAAGEQLGKDKSGPASEFVAHAASGLEGLARSVHGKSTGEMVDLLRHFGRTNPVGFLATSVLAGVALGRFAAAGSSSTSAPRPQKPQSTGAAVPDIHSPGSSDGISHRSDRGMPI